MSSRYRLWALSTLVLVGCSPQSGNLIDTNPAAVTVGVSGAKDGSADVDASSPPSDVCANKPSGNDRRDEVCHRWQCEGRAGSSPATWSGNASTCSAGEVDAEAAERTLRLINLHRFLADVDSVTAISSWSGAAQKCALVAHANGKLSHTPTPDWKCWSETAALTSSLSLIANRSGPPSIAAFMDDPGNETSMVHRRWLLSEELARVGVGSTDHYACIVVHGEPLSLGADDSTSSGSTPSATATKRGWVAWPPAGPVPIDMFASEHLDEMGWTIQSASDDLDRASLTVTVMVDGVTKAVRTSHLVPRFGSRSAIRFVPDGWKTESGRSYEVSVIAGRTTIHFVVEPVDC